MGTLAADVGTIDAQTSGEVVKPGQTMNLEMLVDRLPVTELQRQMIRGRWLDQIHYMSRKADYAKKRYYILRFIGVVGGVLVPAFVSLSLGSADYALRVGTFIASLLVAVSAASEILLRYGERWRHYRRNAEVLKTEGWQYLMAVGPYKRTKDRDAAFKLFSTRVEEILQQDIQGYMSSVAASTNVERHDVFTRI